MPGPISQSYKGPIDNAPYVPSWCYDNNNPPKCSCGHHHGFHNDAGVCLQMHHCKCGGYDGVDPDATRPTETVSADSAGEKP